jgi:hypothetical protein
MLRQEPLRRNRLVAQAAEDTRSCQSGKATAYLLVYRPTIAPRTTAAIRTASWQASSLTPSLTRLPS